MGWDSQQSPRQLEVWSDTTLRKIKNQGERIEWNLTGKREKNLSECKDDRSKGMWHGAHGAKHEDRAEATTGPFEVGSCETASNGHGFAISSRTAP